MLGQFLFNQWTEFQNNYIYIAILGHDMLIHIIDQCKFTGDLNLVVLGRFSPFKLRTMAIIEYYQTCRYST